MLKIGCHLSAAAGYLQMGKTALDIKANTLQFFTRSPQGGRAKPLDVADITALSDFLQKHSFAPVVAHAPYTMNPCSDKKNLRGFAVSLMRDDLARLEHLPGNYYNFHPGSHVKQGVSRGIELICEFLNQVLTAEQSTMVLLETMAGRGSEVGKSFAELAQIRAGVKLADKVGICLDTCHVYDAGYDLVENLDGVLKEFDELIGLEHLRVIHLNDSKNPLGSRKDRHELIGAGTLGLDAIKRIINHPSLRNLPFILETPTDVAGYAREIDLLSKLYE
ncbi:MAG: deoxyribonuclease IV [Bacillota bacterium]